MLSSILFLLLGPFVAYLISQHVLAEGNVIRVYLHEWAKASAYYIGIGLGSFVKAMSPNTDEHKEKLKELSVKDSLDKGIKEIWK